MSTTTRTDETATASQQVVRRVAAETGSEPTDLPPLFTVVDPDALDELVASVDQPAEFSVEFQYVGRSVRVRGDGTVEVGREETRG